MSAHAIYHHAPLGSLVRYSDGTPKPPARFARKLAAWEHRHGVARLVKKEPPRDRSNGTSPANIKLQERVSDRGPRNRIWRQKRYRVAIP